MVLINFIIFLYFCFAELIALPFYHQNDYNIIFERAEIIWYNHTYVSNLTYNFRRNRNGRTDLNASGYLRYDLTTEVTGVAKFYKFTSNEYRDFPMTVGINLCEEYKKNNFRAKELLKNISNIHDCPWKKGYYYLKNNGVYPDYSVLPPYIPRGSYKANGLLYYKNALVGEGNAYGRVENKHN